MAPIHSFLTKFHISAQGNAHWGLLEQNLAKSPFLKIEIFAKTIISPKSWDFSPYYPHFVFSIHQLLACRRGLKVESFFQNLFILKLITSHARLSRFKEHISWNFCANIISHDGKWIYCGLYKRKPRSKILENILDNNELLQRLFHQNFNLIFQL